MLDYRQVFRESMSKPGRKVPWKEVGNNRELRLKMLREDVNAALYRLHLVEQAYGLPLSRFPEE